MQWEESALRFRFGPRWVVRRYDAHRFYRAISGSDMKGVDFVAIYDDRRLVFIEVKNYTLRFGDTLPERVPPRDAPLEFAAHVSRKWRDSLQAVRIFQLVLLRSRRYRFFHRLFNRFLPAHHDWRFWTRAYALSKNPESTHAMLWLELADSYPQREARYSLERRLQRVAEGLETGLPAGIGSVCVNSTRTPLDADVLTVDRM